MLGENVEDEGDEVASCVDACEVEGGHLLDYFLIGNRQILTVFRPFRLLLDIQPQEIIRTLPKCEPLLFPHNKASNILPNSTNGRPESLILPSNPPAKSPLSEQKKSQLIYRFP